MLININGIVILCIVFIENTQGLSYHDKIVGGVDANILEHPYLVSLKRNGKHICGGAIADSSTILTAAHCVNKNLPQFYTVTAGSDFSNHGGFTYGIKYIISHENYSSITFNNDIAILKTSTPITMRMSVQPIPLASYNQIVLAKSMSTIVGWGVDNETSTQVAYRVRRVIIPIIDNFKCKLLYAKVGHVTENQLCAGLTKGGKDACQGDSGGPLAASGKLIGIVSWGYGCARPGYPGVYTRVSKYRYWIDTHR